MTRVPYALLVKLVARKVKGILYIDQVKDVNPELFDLFFAPEQSVDVVIARNDGNGRIKLKIDQEAKK